MVMIVANEVQVGGDHYKGSEYQHWDFVTDMYGGGYLVGCATKYIHRHAKKNGKQDLEKALHYLEKLKELDQPPLSINMVEPVNRFCAEDTQESTAIRLTVAGMYDEAQKVVAVLVMTAYP